jgi:hypothetical protein
VNANNITTIFLDIDGVCNRFCWYILQRLGVAFNDESDWPTHCDEIVDAANHILGFPVYTNESFWSSITRDMWADCPPSVEFPYLVNRSVELVGRKNVFFLTSPARDPNSAAGKIEWIQKFAPPWMQRQFLIGPPKWACARADRMLIDDTEKQVNKFREHGGQALLVPRPWNCLRKYNTAEYLATNMR